LIQGCSDGFSFVSGIFAGRAFEKFFRRESKKVGNAQKQAAAFKAAACSG